MCLSPAAIERLTLTGTGNYYGEGNALDNVISGNRGNNELRGEDGDDTLFGGDGNDTLKGGAGIDAMIGGKGDDTYWIDSKNEVVTEKTGEGYDTVVAGFSHILGANLEGLDLLDGNIDGTGNALANSINGGSGNNQLDGGAGDDNIEGGDGNDTLLGGAGHDDLYGGDGNDSIQGGDGDDYLQGNNGKDTMAGGAGKDYYVVDTDGDVVTEKSNEGNDTVQASISYALGAEVENLVLDEGGDFKGEGNALTQRPLRQRLAEPAARLWWKRCPVRQQRKRYADRRRRQRPPRRRRRER